MKLFYSGTFLLLAFLLSFHTVSAQIIWSEDFTYPDGTVMGPAGKWAATCGACLNGDYFEVRNNGLRGSDVNDFSVWLSEVINISSCSDVSFSLSAVESGDHEGPGCGCGVNIDYFDIYYSINGGAFQVIENWNNDGEPGHTLTGDTQNGMFTDADWQSTVITQGGLSGNTLQLRQIIRNTAGPEIMILDDVVVNCTPLPVEMVSLEATPVGDAVEVRWETAMEAGSNYFDIERSHNGTTFFSIGRVAAAGNSDAVETYQFTDYQPISGASWYRLKQVDQDGSYTLTQLVRVNADAPAFELTNLAPNPASETFQVAFQSRDAADGYVQVFDLMGQELKRIPVAFQAGETSVEVGVHDLAAGVYVLRAGSGTETITKRFMVE